MIYRNTNATEYSFYQTIELLINDIKSTSHNALRRTSHNVHSEYRRVASLQNLSDFYCLKA